jgi:hypothetical protein
VQRPAASTHVAPARGDANVVCRVEGNAGRIDATCASVVVACRRSLAAAQREQTRVHRAHRNENVVVVDSGRVAMSAS